VALSERGAAAQDAGVSAEGSGAGVAGEAPLRSGGYYGYFSDPDGYLWKVASPS
jgi:hypothetical protein